MALPLIAAMDHMFFIPLKCGEFSNKTKIIRPLKNYRCLKIITTDIMQISNSVLDNIPQCDRLTIVLFAPFTGLFFSTLPV